MLGEEQRIIRENIRILQTLEQVSLSKVENGNGILSDVLRLRMSIQELEKEIELLENQKSKYYARINEAINRPGNDTIYVTVPLEESVSIPLDFEELLSKVEENHPIINQLNLAVETSLKEQELSRREGLPSFGFGLDYSLVKKRTDLNPEGNGGDMLIPSFMVSIPLYRKKYNAKKQEEDMMQDAYAFQKESVLNSYSRMLYEYRADLEDALIKLELYRQQKETAESAASILLDYYSSHGSRFEEILQVQEQVYNYNIAIVQAIAQMHIARAGIDQLTNY
jgi:outer membrane protein TolC